MRLLLLSALRLALLTAARSLDDRAWRLRVATWNARCGVDAPGGFPGIGGDA